MTTRKSRSKNMSSNHVDLLLDHGLDLDNRSIWLGNAITQETDESGIEHNLMERFVRSLSILNRTAKKDPITIYLATPGGDQFAGMGIYDAIMASASPVDIIVVGKCMSMGVVILQAARTRILMPNSVLMTHAGNMSEGGHKYDVKRWVDFYTKFDKKIDDLIHPRLKASNPSLSRSAYDKLNDFDTILMANEAIDLGFADRLFDPKKDKI